jgi:hypothetical protein
MIDQPSSRPARRWRRFWLLALVTLALGVSAVGTIDCCDDPGPATPVLTAYVIGEPQRDRTHHPDQSTAGNCAPVDLGIVGDIGADQATGARVPARYADVSVPSRRAPTQPSRPPSLAQLCLLRQ